MYFVQIIGFNIYIYSKYLCCISQHILFHIYTKVISLPGSTVPGTLQARTLKWVAIFLLQCVKVKSESEVTQSCPTLSDPMDCSLPGSYWAFNNRMCLFYFQQYILTVCRSGREQLWLVFLTT